MADDCLFCKIAGRKIEATIVYDDREMVAFKDIRPRAPVHILFIPKKHISGLAELSPEDTALMGRIFLKIRDTAKELGVSEDGYRTVINCNRNAGQEVFHLHVHLLGGRVFSWPPG